MTDSALFPTASLLFLNFVDQLVRLLGDGMCAATRPLGVEILCYQFMQQAFVAGLCVGVVAPLVGSFLVHREMAFIGDTLAHTAFAGVAIGLFLGSAFEFGVSPYVTALIVAVLSALLIEFIADYTDAYGDVSMAIVLSGGFALGTVIISLTDGGIAVGISQYLFGSLSTVTLENTSILLVLSAVVVGVVALTYKQLLFVTFDETAARVARLNVSLYNRLMVVLTAVVVVAAMQIMGVILVAAMLVVPVAAAAQVARSFRESVLAAVVVGELAVLLGLVASYQYGVAAGGAIVLVAIGLYAASIVADKAIPRRSKMGETAATDGGSEISSTENSGNGRNAN
ncbi:ABC transporter permease [Haloprofundus marisrubri]|uniref:ABC transporter permease n=1 Tax=Haloprofundus marisrubri TaxID=1514971 RepID=A0A0W1R8J4_9EURY|nr:metal ABC transporter permease [Haloprofundus marisrubri]KTG09284.1 ABC transporter permease [Haloprofundus marisrubri]